MQLTPEQKQALDSGEPVPVVVDDTACVLVRQDVYDRLRVVLGDMDPEEAYAAIIEAWDEQGSPDDEHLYKDV